MDVFFPPVWIPPRTSCDAAAVRALLHCEGKRFVSAQGSLARQSSRAMQRRQTLCCAQRSRRVFSGAIGRPTSFLLLPALDTFSSFRISSLPFGSESWRRRTLCQVEPPCGSFAWVLRPLREFWNKTQSMRNCASCWTRVAASCSLCLTIATPPATLKLMCVPSIALLLLKTLANLTKWLLARAQSRKQHRPQRLLRAAAFAVLVSI